MDSSKECRRRHYGCEFDSVRFERDILMARSERHERVFRRGDDREFGILYSSKFGLHPKDLRTRLGHSRIEYSLIFLSVLIRIKSFKIQLCTKNV